MSDASPFQLIALGFLFVFIGFLVPFLMVIGILPAGFILSIISYLASVGGLILGVIGAAFYVRERNR
jgi:membrane associated rhomboid family serine protease